MIIVAEVFGQRLLLRVSLMLWVACGASELRHHYH